MDALSSCKCRGKNIIKSIFLAFALLITLNTFGQPLNQAGSVSLSTNLIKDVMGIPNLEVEYNVAPSFSIKVFAEVLAFDYIYDRSKHPDFVTRIGPYYHFLANKSENQDLQLGTFGGYTWSKNTDDLKGMNVGLELGYKYQFSNSFYLFPRGLITYPFQSKKPFPGLELLIGKVIN
ncbi:MAG: hypothetical protein AMS27_14865 [Bacteroides sp. SM23_62_1]|nr:MAG: hypothetical protein AMS27_14865 [Bacteroides sp. SM23_62_1]